MTPLGMAAFHAKHNCAEEIKEADESNIEDSEDGPLEALVMPCQRPRHPVEHEAHGQDRKVQRGVVMMDICHARHGHKREIM